MGFRVWDFELKGSSEWVVLCIRMVPDLDHRAVVFRVWGSEFRGPPGEFRDSGFRFRDRGLGNGGINQVGDGGGGGRLPREFSLVGGHDASGAQRRVHVATLLQGLGFRVQGGWRFLTSEVHTP